MNAEAKEPDTGSMAGTGGGVGARRRLDALWRDGLDYLGCRYAIIGGAMSWVSEHKLVAAISNAGAFGVLAASAMPPQNLRDEIDATRALTDKPFGVNLVTLHPLFGEVLDVCIELEVRHVVLAGGLPPQWAIGKLKDAGAKVMCFAPALALARRLIRNGADALVLEGREAGGHIGPSTTTVLAQEILPHIAETPLFVAGGIARGEVMAAFLEMGAAGCQIGTRFACARESTAHPNFKKALLSANARDAVVSPQLDHMFKVIPVRALLNKAMEEFFDIQHELLEQIRSGRMTAAEAQVSIEHFWAGRLRRAAVHGDVEQGSVMAGQSVGLVKAEQAVSEIIEEMVEQALGMLDRDATGGDGARRD